MDLPILAISYLLIHQVYLISSRTLLYKASRSILDRLLHLYESLILPEQKVILSVTYKRNLFGFIWEKKRKKGYFKSN